jgi:hypothetical protein
VSWKLSPVRITATWLPDLAGPISSSHPGYAFKIVDALITNFHLPESTLLMLVSAMAGRENILRAYQAAIDERYRFFSFGDAMFITRRKDTCHSHES